MRQKTDLLAALEAGCTLKEAVERARMGWMTLGRLAQEDTDVAKALAAYDAAARHRLEGLIDDATHHAERYETELKRPVWGNFAMFRLKKLEPAYRDSAQVQITNQVAVADLGPIMAAIRQLPDPDRA